MIRILLVLSAVGSGSSLFRNVLPWLIVLTVIVLVGAVIAYYPCQPASGKIPMAMV